MIERQTSLPRGILSALLAGGTAFLVVFFWGELPVEFHAWALGASAVIFAISDSHFGGLLSELGALLRRGTYSVWQLDQLSQTVPLLRKRVAFVWQVSTWLKAFVGVACGLLLWANLSPAIRPEVLFLGYSFLFYSIILALWGRKRFRELEEKVDDLTRKEASAKEKRRLLQELESGEKHDFDNDKLAQGYTKPPTPIN